MDKPLLLNSFALHPFFEAVQFSQKLKPLRNGLLKIIIKRTEVTYELLKQAGKTIHRHRNLLILYYPREPLLFPHIQSYIKHNRHDSKFLYTSYDKSEFDDIVFLDL